MKRNCDICGKECEERDMEKISPSPAHPKWLCWTCFKNSQYQAKKSDLHRHQRLYMIAKSKKGIK